MSAGQRNWSDVAGDPLRTLELEREPPTTSTSLDLEGKRAFAAIKARLIGRGTATSVGRYTLARKLGEGGFGAVFEARDTKLDRNVAIKVVRERSSGPARAYERLGAEARALAQLGDAHVVEVFDVGTDVVDDQPHLYIVMELLAGPTLEQWQRGRSPEAIMGAYLQAARGLSAAHSIGVVHRDFKPANAMFTHDDRVKVLDFGLASGEPTTPPSDPSEELTAERLTHTGFVMGTPRYMAPEQHRGAEADHRCDQFAWCVALWEALTASPPFDADSLSGLEREKEAGPPRRPKAIPRALYRVLARGLAPDPSERFPSMTALVGALRPQGWRPRLALGMAAVAMATIIPLQLVAAEPDLCSEAPPSWSDAFEATVDALQPERGTSQWGIQPKIEARLVRFDEQFADARTHVCDAAPESLAPDASVSVQCLQRAAARFGEVLAARNGDDPLQEITRKLMPLPIPSRCLGAQAERLFVRDVSAEASVAAIDEALLSDRSLSHAELDALWDQALQLDNPWLLTRVATTKTWLYTRTAEPAKAAAVIDDAVWHAEAAGDTLLAAEVLPIAVAQLLDSGLRRAEIEPWLARAHRVSEAAGRPRTAHALLMVTEALIFMKMGSMAEGAVRIERAVALVDGQPPPGLEGLFALVLALDLNLGIEERSVAEIEAKAEQILAMGTLQDKWYANTASMVHHSLAENALRVADYERATVERLNQIGMLRHDVAFEAWTVQFAIAGYAVNLAWAGGDALARDQIAQTYATLETSGPGTELQRSYLAYELFALHTQRGEYVEALAWSQRQLDELQAVLGTTDAGLAAPFAERAFAAAKVGELDRARASLANAERMLDPEDWEAQRDTWLAEGTLALAERRYADALAPLKAIADDETEVWTAQLGQRIDACEGLRQAYEALGDVALARWATQCRDSAAAKAGGLRAPGAVP